MYPVAYGNRINKPTKVKLPLLKKKGRSSISVVSRRQTNQQKQATEKIYGVSMVKDPIMRRLNEYAKKRNLIMHPCTAKFALAIADPMNPSVRGVCIPSSGGMTQRVLATFVTDLTIGTGGFAFIYVTPSLANNTPCLYYTSGAFAGTGSSTAPFSANNTLTTGVLRGLHNGPYTATQLVVGSTSGYTNGRIPACGLRVQYTGKTTNEGGVYYCRHELTHNSLSGSLNGDIGNTADSEVRGINREPCLLAVHPVDDDELNFSTEAAGANIQNTAVIYPYSNNTSGWSTTFNGTTIFNDTVNSIAVGVPVGVILITGTAGETIHLDYYQHMEFQGTLAAPAAIKAESDLEGAKKVVAAAKMLPVIKRDTPTAMFSPWKAMHEALSEIWATVKPIVVTASATALTAALM
jgi:hypothetical protein